MEERIVVTGMGAISSLGMDVNQNWENIVNGVTGISEITLFDTEDSQVKFACEVKDFQPNKYFDRKKVRRLDRFELFAGIAAREAISQSGLHITRDNAHRISVIIASGIGGLTSLQNGVITMHEKGGRRVSPFLIPMLMSNGASSTISLEYGITGQTLSVVSACASGSDAIGIAWFMLRAGLIDFVICGASEAAVTKIGVAAFHRLGAVSRYTENTPRPFDKNRDGLIMGEGSAVLVLERASTANERGAEIFAELAGYAATSDAYHITAPDDSGSGSAMAIKNALATGNVSRRDVNYINAHGTGTILNDAAETKAIKTVFGDLAYNIPISSTKSMTGHMMGATGALEAIFCIKAIRDGIIPPTINYHDKDPVCDLDYVPNNARKEPVEVAVSNSFGFGGHNSVLVFRR